MTPQIVQITPDNNEQKWLPINMKVGNMRSPQDFEVNGMIDNTSYVIMRSDSRIARVDLVTGDMVISDGVGTTGLHKLASSMGAVTTPCPVDVLSQLRIRFGII